MPDVVFTTSGPAYWKCRAPHLIGYNLPHYVYPESPYFQNIPLKDRFHWMLWRRLIRYFYNRDADAIVVQTNDVRDRVKQLIQCEDISVVSNTCGAHFFRKNASFDNLFEREPSKIYLLCLTAYYAHKNLEIFNEVLELLEDAAPGKFRLVLTLPPEKLQMVVKKSLRESVINVGPVSPESCPSLYKNSDFTILPTLLECFSATYVESMAMGKPILTSDIGFAKSICQDAAVYFDPVDPHSMVKAILSLWGDEDRIRSLVKNGFRRLSAFPDASQRAAHYIKICKKLATVSS
jgi:glycosyltransferase involved in cell wall biosynthesis